MMMMLGTTVFWGVFASIVFTTLLAASQGLGLTRMNIPFLLGTMVTPDRDRARIYGVLIHLLIGIVLSLLYLGAFHAWGGATWWKGLAFGAVHGAFFLTFGVSLLPGLHPRMASEHEGPTTVRPLEPPGFLGLNYGPRTPVSIFASHLVWGLLLGATLR